MMGLATAYLPRVSDLRALAVSALMLSQVFANPICFGNEGVQTSSFFSCQPDASESACCAPGDICYSNGLCSPGPTENQDTATPFFWNGCTNATFEIPECFSACYNLPGNGVQVCANAGPNHYCCYQFGGCNCSDPSQVFSIAAATILTTIDPAINHTSSTTTTTATTTTSRATTTASSSGASVTTSSSTGSGTSSAPTSSNTSAAPVQKSSSEVPVGVPIGVGVGIGVPLVLVIIAFVIYVLRRRSGGAYPPVVPPEDQKPFQSPELGGYYNNRVELSGHPAHEYSPYSAGELSSQ